MLVSERYFRIGRWGGIVENYTLRDDGEADEATRCDDRKADDQRSCMAAKPMTAKRMTLCDAALFQTDLARKARFNCFKKTFWILEISVHTFGESSRGQECHQPSRASHGGKTMRTNSQNKC